MRHLDETMAGSLAGEESHRDTAVFTSCTTMISCTTCAEFERAVQWIRATDHYTRRYGSPLLYVECRVRGKLGLESRIAAAAEAVRRGTTSARR